MDSPGTVPYQELQGSEVPRKGQWRVEGWLLHRHRSRNETAARLVPALASVFQQEEVEPRDRSNDMPWV